MESHERGSVLISGAFSGIGKASALALAARGYRVYAGMLDKRQLESFQSDHDGDRRLVPLVLDICNEASIAAAVALIEAGTNGAGLSALVNNAGIALAGPVEYLPVATLRRQLEVNLVGHFAVTQVCIPLLRLGSARGCGRIINIGSVSSRVSNIFLSPYAMSKHALKAFNDSLRMELKPWGIWVSLIEPGNVTTSIWETAFKEVDRFLGTLPPRGVELYGSMIQSMMAAVATKGKPKIMPEDVAARVVHAVESTRPRAYYPIGFDRFYKVALSRLLTAEAYDRFIYGFLGLKDMLKKGRR